MVNLVDIIIECPARTTMVNTVLDNFNNTVDITVEYNPDLPIDYSIPRPTETSDENTIEGNIESSLPIERTSDSNSIGNTIDTSMENSMESGMEGSVKNSEEKAKENSVGNTPKDSGEIAMTNFTDNTMDSSMESSTESSMESDIDSDMEDTLENWMVSDMECSEKNSKENAMGNSVSNTPNDSEENAMTNSTDKTESSQNSLPMYGLLQLPGQCVLCKTFDDSEALGEKMKIYNCEFHLNCALLSGVRASSHTTTWSKIRLYQRVVRLIDRSKKIICDICEEPGASVTCKPCTTPYHLPCVLRQRCICDVVNQHMHCDLHSTNVNRHAFAPLFRQRRHQRDESEGVRNERAVSNQIPTASYQGMVTRKRKQAEERKGNNNE